MRRTVLLTLAWACGTAVAVGFATAAINLVGDRVTNRPIGAVSEAAGAGDGGVSPSTTVAVSQPGAPVPSAPGAPSTTSPQTAGARPSGSPATTAPPTQPPPASNAKTFNLTGGRVNASCTASTIQLVWATPNAGYQVEIEKSGPEEVEVRFRSDAHESRVRASCSGGVPTGELREDGHG